MKRKIVRGIWFFGMSGAGKSYISSALSKKKKNSVIVDGDDVRKYISIDLGYD
ncbi:MAG: adenylyl-sulfate kinase, partial [Gammaproteobacteria bacterium]|nr:adenylyl-sulfate kinase [Gammaproteobacteria bacterium]